MPTHRGSADREPGQRGASARPQRRRCSSVPSRGTSVGAAARGALGRGVRHHEPGASPASLGRVDGAGDVRRAVAHVGELRGRRACRSVDSEACRDDAGRRRRDGASACRRRTAPGCLDRGRRQAPAPGAIEDRPGRPSAWRPARGGASGDRGGRACKALGPRPPGGRDSTTRSHVSSRYRESGGGAASHRSHDLIGEVDCDEVGGSTTPAGFVDGRRPEPARVSASSTDDQVGVVRGRRDALGVTAEALDGTAPSRQGGDSTSTYPQGARPDGRARSTRIEDTPHEALADGRCRDSHDGHQDALT